MSVSGSQVAAHYHHQAQQLGAVIEAYRQLQSKTQEADATVVAQLKVARRELAAIYLPALEPAAFERTGKLTGFQGFMRRDPRAAMEHERHVLKQSLTKVEADPLYANRDMIAQQMADELAGARDTLAPLQAECEKFESQPGFKELVDIGYDTPRFAEKWWQASYWKHWAAGDRICKALDMNDFGDDVLPAYAKAAEPRNYMLGEVKRIESRIDALHDIVRERDRIVDRLANLEQIYLHEAQDYLGDHLELADSALLEQWISNEPELQRPVQMGIRKIAGLIAKRRFLSELGAHGIQNLIMQLEQRRGKAQAKEAKFLRPKNTWATFSNDMIVHDFDQKMQGLHAQRDKLNRRVDSLVAAENYASFDLRNDQELWWVHFVGSPPPRLVPNTFDYYARRPNAQPVTDPDYVDMGPTPGEAAAMAYAAGELEPQGGYLS